MVLSEKAAYLNGLMEGLKIEEDDKYGKVLCAMRDLLTEIADTVDTIDADLDDVVEFCSVIDEDLAAIEDDLYEDECECGCGCGPDCDCGCQEGGECTCHGECGCGCDCDCDEDTYEVVCPTCGDTIELTYEMVAEGSINCPNCGELLEFDLDDDCDCCDCE